MLTAAKTRDTITLPGQGRICQIGTSTTSLSAQGTFDFQNGTGKLAGVGGQGSLEFTTGPSATSAASRAGVVSVPDEAASVFAIVLVFGMIFGAACGSGGCF